MIKIDELIGTKALRAFATKAALPEVVKLLVDRAIVDEISTHIIQVQCSIDFEETGEYEIILWGQ